MNMKGYIMWYTGKFGVLMSEDGNEFFFYDPDKNYNKGDMVTFFTKHNQKKDRDEAQIMVVIGHGEDIEAISEFKEEKNKFEEELKKLKEEKSKLKKELEEIIENKKVLIKEYEAKAINNKKEDLEKIKKKISEAKKELDKVKGDLIN
ncbi:MAG: hypothetical protein ACE5KE_10215, partial [Methanosarcinales archaeon]